MKKEEIRIKVLNEVMNEKNPEQCVRHTSTAEKEEGAVEKVQNKDELDEKVAGVQELLKSIEKIEQEIIDRLEAIKKK